MLFTCFLIALAGIDLRTRLLPDQLTLPLLWLGLIASVENVYIGQKAALLGAMAGYLSLWSVYWVFKQLTGKEGMGHGDFKLLAALGAWVGLKGILPTILLSSLVGAVIGSASGWPEGPRPRDADSLRPLPRDRRLDRVLLERFAGRCLPVVLRPEVRRWPRPARCSRSA